MTADFRYVVRDADSRLNVRERFAVEEWIQSGTEVHAMHDHMNHGQNLNGGMWGATQSSCVRDALLKNMNNDLKYMADLYVISPIYTQCNVFDHTSYLCTNWPHSHPFPTQRSSNLEHVGQVFDSNDKPRMSDIDGFMRLNNHVVEVAPQCRKQKEWLYG